MQPNFDTCKVTDNANSALYRARDNNKQWLAALCAGRRFLFGSIARIPSLTAN